jgi:hypothetical protein
VTLRIEATLGLMFIGSGVMRAAGSSLFAPLCTECVEGVFSEVRFHDPAYVTSIGTRYSLSAALGALVADHNIWAACMNTRPAGSHASGADTTRE